VMNQHVILVGHEMRGSIQSERESLKFSIPLAEYWTGVMEEPFDEVVCLVYLCRGNSHWFSDAFPHSVDKKDHCVA